MSDRESRLNDVLGALRRGKLALTIEGLPFLHAFLLLQKGNQSAGPALQLKAPTELPGHHLRVFVDNGELAFVTADETEAPHTPGRHPWSLHLPLAAAQRRVEETLGPEQFEAFKTRFLQACRLAPPDDCANIWILVGTFDADLGLAALPFSKSRGTRLAAESLRDRVRIVRGDEFCTSDHDVGFALDRDGRGAVIAVRLIYRLPTGAGALVVDILHMMIEIVAFGSLVAEAIRPALRANFELPSLPDASVLIDDVMHTIDRHLQEWRRHGLAFPWDVDFLHPGVGHQIPARYRLPGLRSRSVGRRLRFAHATGERSR